MWPFCFLLLSVNQTLGLLVNLMEHCVVNRRLLVETRLTGRVSLLAETADMDAIYALVQVASDVPWMSVVVAGSGVPQPSIFSF